MPEPNAAPHSAWAATFVQWPRRLQRRLVARWIGAGLGCDSSVEAIAARGEA